MVGITIIYILASLILLRWVRIDAYQLILYMTVTFFIAIVCEVGLGKVYFLIMGKPLWQYHVLPIHGAFTSQLNFIIWPVYGFYLYLLHYVLLSKGIISRPKWIHGISSGLDGPLLEILANGFFLLFYRTFYFYYLPDDIRHYTSFQVIPLYMVMGIILSVVVENMCNRPRKWQYPIIFYLLGLGFIFLG